MKQTKETEEVLRKIERAIMKLCRNLMRADLDYTVQISITSTDPKKVRYAAQMTPPAEGLAPVTFITDSAEELIEQIKAATKSINYEDVEVAYHEAQIESCLRTIKGHEERIEKIKNPPEQEEDKGGEETE